MPDALKVANRDEGLELEPVPSVVEEKEEKEKEARPAKQEANGFFKQRPHAKWILGVLALALIAGTVAAWQYYSARESTDDAQVDSHIDPISARVSGTVVKVLADDNQQVEGGAPLVELDPKDYEVALQRARADLANAQANAAAAHVNVPLTTTTSSSQLTSANAGTIAAEKEVAAAKARVQEAQANSTKADADLKRLEQLVQKDEVSRQQYDGAVAAAASSQATLEAAIAAVATAESRFAQAKAQAESAGTAPQQISMIRARENAALAEVERSRAALAQAELNMQYTKIAAPVAGIISKRNVEPGQVVQAGQPLFALVNLDDIWITANFKETQLKSMKVGQRVNIHVDAYGRDYSGVVESMGGATGARFSLLPPENATGNYVKVVQRVPVRIRLDKNSDSSHLLRPGMSVEPVVLTR
ncbi:MAG TPA: HlyD family secretion protein [Candidatus Angelobacter sp.]|nr:HlyD family secretion protein [Candidatus Angelobacter sp.]